MFCSNCGNELQENANFCAKCGKAVTGVNTVAENNDFDDVDFYNRGLEQYNNGDYTEAIKSFTQAIEHCADDTEPIIKGCYYSCRSLAYEKLEDYQNALQDISEVINLDGDDDQGNYTQRSRIYEKLEDYQNALQDLSKAIDIAPSDPLCYKRRGGIYFALGESQKAINDYDKALQIGFGDDDIDSEVATYDGRGLAYMQLGFRKDYGEKALADFRKAEKLAPQKRRRELIKSVEDKLSEFEEANGDNYTESNNSNSGSDIAKTLFEWGGAFLSGFVQAWLDSDDDDDD